MPKIEQSGIYSDGHDSIYFAAGTNVSELVFRTFKKVADGTPADIAEAHQANAHPGLYAAQTKAAEVQAQLDAERAGQPVENRAADAQTADRNKSDKSEK